MCIAGIYGSGLPRRDDQSGEMSGITCHLREERASIGFDVISVSHFCADLSPVYVLEQQVS